MTQKFYCDRILSFYKTLEIKSKLPKGVEVMNPYREASAFALCEKFYRKYFSDHQERTLILGINPGRFGGGITGVPFTDPIKLEEICGIPNELKKKAELSADFIYEMISAYGGPDLFYKRFYISAISPLGFVKEGKNLNYYDIRELEMAIEPFIIDCLQKQIAFGTNTTKCFCLGEGENFKYLERINKKYSFFEKVIPLAHPRFIMQYKRKSVPVYVKDYLAKLNSL
jgi:hypothetical protein